MQKSNGDGDHVMLMATIASLAIIAIVVVTALQVK
jgi:hypothetical protein